MNIRNFHFSVSLRNLIYFRAALVFDIYSFSLFYTHLSEIVRFVNDMETDCHLFEENAIFEFKNFIDQVQSELILINNSRNSS